MTTSMKWLDRVRGNDSIREAARKAGTTHATLNRQAKEDAFTFEIVRDLSRAYGRTPLTDLVELGLLTLTDVGGGTANAALSAATDEDLVIEVGRRMGIQNASALFDMPVSEAVASVHPIRRAKTNVGGFGEDLAEVASEPFGLHEDDTDDKY